MCTVSFYKTAQQTIITSNRDEHIERPLALAPQKRVHGAQTVYYPIDPKANGTWFGVKNNGTVLVLLNGADVKHVSKPPYRKSRGLILLEMLSSNSVLKTWHEMDLSDIEPFTIIAFLDKQLWQLRWNSTQKNTLELDANRPHIWSSATLYDELAVRKRETWFTKFIAQKKETITANDCFDFHTKTELEDSQNGLIINRNQSMLTQNVTQCVITHNSFVLTHYTCATNEKTTIIESIC
jgi:uncharacterized protein with NRDE domain